MLHPVRKVVGSTLAILVAGSVTWPGIAAAAPTPLPEQWWFKGWGVQTHLWPLSTGKGVTVAVLDTGVEADLPELQGVVLPGMNAEGGSGDGRIDLDQETSPPGHGTAMASLIAAQGRGTGFVGVAPDAKILPVVTQSPSAYAKGIRFAVDRGAQVINLSQAVPRRCPEELQESIAYALGKDAVIVVGAGNDGNGVNSSNTPANCKGVLSVGAVDLKDRPWEKTQRQPYLKVAGPGVGTKVPMKDGKLYSGSGTSDAAALVSGAVALIRARHPDMKNREVVRQLIASAKDIYTEGKDDRTGYGMIRPYRPLAGKAPKGTANPVFDEFDRWMKEHHPEGVKSSSAPSANSDSLPINPTAVLAGIALVAGGVVLIAVSVIRRRSRRRSPMPMQIGTPPPQGWGGQAGVPHQTPQVPPPGGQHYIPPQAPSGPPGQYPPR